MKIAKLVVPALLALAPAACTNMQNPGKGAAHEMAPPQLPPGWTQDDMKAMMEAGTPGEMHKFLASGAGRWKGENTMWMGPDAPPMKTRSTATLTPIMGGRFVKLETSGDMPGMPTFHGFGLYGYDNVAGKFVSTWIDNMGTTMMTGTGELSADRKTLTWQYSFTCPINKKPTPMREIETFTGPNTRTLDMFTLDPKSGKEYKCVHIDMTRTW
jgi:hypothetical protein